MNNKGGFATTGLSCGQADLECCSSYRGRLETTVVALEEGGGPLSWLFVASRVC